MTQVSGELLVPFRLGAKKGLTPLEHLLFAMDVPHPSENGVSLKDHLLEAIDFECRQSIEVGFFLAKTFGQDPSLACCPRTRAKQMGEASARPSASFGGVHPWSSVGSITE